MDLDLYGRKGGCKDDATIIQRVLETADTHTQMVPAKVTPYFRDSPRTILWLLAYKREPSPISSVVLPHCTCHHLALAACAPS